MKTETAKAKRSLMTAMLIFGTIGIFRKYIPLTSSTLAMARGFIGMVFLLAMLALRREAPDMAAIRRQFPVLALSGALIGLNWIALFEAYRYTSVAVATLCYYMAPVIVILLSPIVLGEGLTPLKGFCAFLAFLGMVCVSGVMRSGIPAASELKGIALGLGAACLYACVILMNKKMKPIGAYDKTIVQLGSAAVVLLPYNLLAGEPGAAELTLPVIGLVALVGILHTGIAYALYFGSMGSLKAQTVALYSYIDPVAAIVLSLVVFRESMDLYGMIGAVLILGATLISDLKQ